MLITVTIDEAITASIVRRIDIDTFHLFTIAFPQQIQSLKILGMNQYAVALFVEVGNRRE